MPDVYPFDCRRCDLGVALSVEEILRTGAMGGVGGGECRPNLHKLEEITAQPGEIVIFVRKATFGERFFLYH